jgi:hypothetical protein
MERYQPEYDIEVFLFDEWHEVSTGVSAYECDRLVKDRRFLHPLAPIRITEHIIDNARYGLVKE